MADNNIQKTDSLGNDNISRLILKFAATTLIALLLNSVYNLTDTLFVSWGVGDMAMGGVSVVFPFVILQSAISTAVGGGAASIVSRRLGEGKLKEAGETTFNAMLTFYITAIISTVLGYIFLNPLLNVFGITDALYPYAKQYLTIILLGNVFSTGFSSIIRAEGRMLYGLLIWVIPITVNIILDAIFIFVLKWGVKGSALATVICQFTSFCMSIIFFTRFTSQDFKGAKLKLTKIFEIFAIGIPSLVQIGSLSIITVILNNVLRSSGGTLGITAFAYISKIITFALIPFTAVVQAIAPVAGYNYGKGNYLRVKKALYFAIKISLFYAIAAIILVELFPSLLLRIFTNNEEIISLAMVGLRITAIAFLFAPLPMIIGATYQAINNKLWALILYASNLVFLVPFAFILSQTMGTNGVWFAYVAAGICSTILAIVSFFCKKRGLLTSN